MTGDEEQFASLYAEMTESQLMEIAREYDQLVPRAQESLRAEFARRSLEPPLIEDEEPQPKVESQLVTVARFRDLAEGLTARSALEMAGIPCFLADENMVRMEWQLSNYLGGMRLQVRDKDEAEARALLSQPMPLTMKTSDEAEYTQPVCPHCGSLDVILSDLDKKVTAVSYLLGVPIPHWRGREEVWKCSQCGCKWVDDGSEQDGATE